MPLGHIALGIYTLSLTFGIYILYNMTGKTAWFHKIITCLLVVIEIVGIGCVLYYFTSLYPQNKVSDPTCLPICTTKPLTQTQGE